MSDSTHQSAHQPTTSTDPANRPGMPLADAESLRSAGFVSLLIRGILGILLGILLFAAPLASATILATMVVLFIGFWLIFDGIASVALSFKEKKHGVHGWGWTLAGGIAAVIIGIMAVVYPLTAAVAGTLVILWFMAVGLIVRGLFELGNRRLGGWGVALGIINVIAGIIIAIVLWTLPLAALGALIWVAAVYGIIFGIAALIAAFRLRNAA